MQPPGSIPEEVRPPEVAGIDGKQERPAEEKKCRWCGLTETEALSDRTALKRGKPGLPSKAEVAAMIAELQADLTGEDRERAQEAARICGLLSPLAAERLGLVLTGIQAGTVPQTVTAAVAILKAAGLVKTDVGGTAATAELGG
jgi:hypothetical protein